MTSTFSFEDPEVLAQEWPYWLRQQVNSPVLLPSESRTASVCMQLPMIERTVFLESIGQYERLFEPHLPSAIC